MRTYLKLAAAAGSAAALAAAMAPAFAATGAVPVHVLTINKVGGPAVKARAVLKAGIASGKKAVFTIGTAKVTCTAGHVSATVNANPVKPGTARASLTKESLSKCTISVSGVTVKSLKANNLPYMVSVSDATGFPVTVAGTSKVMPISFTATVAVGTTTVSCTYTAASVTGHASNTGNVVRFSKQKLTFATGPDVCKALGTTAVFSATFGPVKDSSVTGSPAVFVN